MLEQLHALLDAVADIPTAGLWVALGFLFYKLFIVGSIVAAVVKCWQMAADAWTDRERMKRESETRLAELETDRHTHVPPPQVHRTEFRGLIIDDCKTDLCEELKRIRNEGGRKGGYKSDYMHAGDVNWLGEAITLQQRVDRGEVTISDAANVTPIKEGRT